MWKYYVILPWLDCPSLLYSVTILIGMCVILNDHILLYIFCLISTFKYHDLESNCFILTPMFTLESSFVQTIDPQWTTKVWRWGRSCFFNVKA